MMTIEEFKKHNEWWREAKRRMEAKECKRQASIDADFIIAPVLAAISLILLMIFDPAFVKYMFGN